MHGEMTVMRMKKIQQHNIETIFPLNMNLELHMAGRFLKIAHLIDI